MFPVDREGEAGEKRPEPIFSVHNLSFSYSPGKELLRGVSLSLSPGENIGLCGANGAGKTTLFRCISGLCKADSGEIRLGSKVMRAEKDFFELRRNVGHALQNADNQLFFPTVLEDICFGPLNLGLPEDEARRRALESLELVGLAGSGSRLNNQLSGGEKRLAALAAILAMRPRALLLDEPLTGLDSGARANIIKVINSLECAKLIISHDRAILDGLCSKRLLLKDGRLAPLSQESELALEKASMFE